MEIMLKQPSIIHKIFDYLELYDVYQCRLVCWTWYEVAVRILKKCPKFDVCSSVARKVVCDVGTFDFPPLQSMYHLEFMVTEPN